MNKVTNNLAETDKDPLQRALGTLALATLISTYLLIVLGSTVRVTESGMGCNGWPLCSGQIGPIDQFHPLLEQSHRYLASIVTVLIFALTLVIWRSGQRGYHLRRFSLAGIILIIVQVALGAITVLTTNAPATVALHLIVGLVFLAVVTALAVEVFTPEQSARNSRLDLDRRSLWALAGLFFVLISGSLVVDGEAEKACPSWPACIGSHAQSGLINLQLIHRMMVLIGMVLVANYVIKTIRMKTTPPLLYRLAVTSLIISIIQIVVGAIVALLKAPDPLADFHLALAAALWAVVVAMATLSAHRQDSATS